MMPTFRNPREGQPNTGAAITQAIAGQTQAQTAGRARYQGGGGGGGGGRPRPGRSISEGIQAGLAQKDIKEQRAKQDRLRLQNLKIAEFEEAFNEHERGQEGLRNEIDRLSAALLADTMPYGMDPGEVAKNMHVLVEQAYGPVTFGDVFDTEALEKDYPDVNWKIHDKSPADRRGLEALYALEVSSVTALEDKGYRTKASQEFSRAHQVTKTRLRPRIDTFKNILNAGGYEGGYNDDAEQLFLDDRAGFGLASRSINTRIRRVAESEDVPDSLLSGIFEEMGLSDTNFERLLPILRLRDEEGLAKFNMAPEEAAAMSLSFEAWGKSLMDELLVAEVTFKDMPKDEAKKMRKLLIRDSQELLRASNYLEIHKKGNKTFNALIDIERAKHMALKAGTIGGARGAAAIGERTRKEAEAAALGIPLEEMEGMEFDVNDMYDAIIKDLDTSPTRVLMRTVTDVPFAYYLKGAATKADRLDHYKATGWLYGDLDLPPEPPPKPTPEPARELTPVEKETLKVLSGSLGTSGDDYDADGMED